MLRELFITTEAHDKSPEYSDISTQRGNMAKTLLTLMSVAFLFLSVVNIVYFQLYALAAIDGAAGMIAAAGTIYAYKTGHTKAVIRLALALPIIAIMSLIHIMEQQHYALFWLTVIPPLCFLLLGKKGGIVVSSLILLYTFFFMYTNLEAWDPAVFGWAAISNITIALVCLMVGMISYESTREAAHAVLLAKNQELERLSSTDHLTKLHNRYRMQITLEQCIASANHTHAPLSIILLDLDSFKVINDKYGHLAGDEVLITLAKLLTTTLPSEFEVGRWGGDEFLIILPGISAAQAANYAITIRDAAKAKLATGAIFSTLSCGIADYQHGEKISHLLSRADEALYQQKRHKPPHPCQYHRVRAYS